MLEFSDVKAFAAEQLDNAKKFSRQIKFAANARIAKSFAEQQFKEVRASVGDDPELAVLEVGDGIAAWSAISAIDLRGSTAMADKLGPKTTYLVTHTLLPTLSYVCEHLGGSLLNFRGDGLLATFGLKKLQEDDGSDEPNLDEMRVAATTAITCGLTLIESTTDAIQVVLDDDGIEADLKVGVGVDCGGIVLTRVGWRSANELTAYGSPVNHASKLSNGVNQIKVSNQIDSLIPSAPGGKLRFNESNDGFVVESSVYRLRRS